MHKTHVILESYSRQFVVTTKVTRFPDLLRLAAEELSAVFRPEWSSESLRLQLATRTTQIRVFLMIAMLVL